MIGKLKKKRNRKSVKLTMGQRRRNESAGHLEPGETSIANLTCLSFLKYGGKRECREYGGVGEKSRKC